MKKLIAFIFPAVVVIGSMQAQAFKFDTPDDWSIRWDNAFKGNLMVRVENQDPSVYDPNRTVPEQAAALADDADYTVKKDHFVSQRIDVLSELDVIWRDTLGFRVSGAGWYDHAYSGTTDAVTSGPTKGFPTPTSTWGSLTVQPGQYTDKARDLHYRGGELLDAFVFANFDVEDVGVNVRVGRHTLYWGQSFLSIGAIHGFAGSMAAVDVSKGFGAPGTEVKELFIPNEKISTSVQFTDKFTVSAFYAYGFEPLRWPEGGTYFSLAEALTENSECFTLSPGTVTTNRTCLKANDYKAKDSGDWGVNFKYYIEPWDLEASFIYMNNTDRLTSGLYSVLDGASEAEAALGAQTGATIAGHYGWVYKDDIDTFGISLAKQKFDISWGADLVYRNNNALNPGNLESISAFYASASEVDPGDNYPGPTGDTVHVVLNGVGFLNAEWGLWEGGSYVMELTLSNLLRYGQFEEKANPLIEKDYWNSNFSGRFNPTWYQVRPGWDFSIPMTINYTIRGVQAPISAGGNEKVGNGSVGLFVDVDQTWSMTLAYNIFFGPQKNGTAAYIKDRDNISLTLKRTF